MAAGAIAARKRAGLQWKPSSLELLWSDAAPAAERLKQLAVPLESGQGCAARQHAWAGRA
eukprot:7087048-Lingulodinium_polyedra.AAC.1